MRKSLLIGSLAAAVAGLAMTGTPAEATSVTFTLGGGSLTVAQPSSAVALTAGALSSLAGSSITGSLGVTTVTDQRGGISGWTSTIAQTTAFTDGSTTIPAANTKVWVASLIVPTGVAVVTSGTYLTQATGLALTSTAQNFVTATAVVGNNSASFNPSIAVTIPGNATAGDYTGVITQTVS
jgi:hypothetical protein